MCASSLYNLKTGQITVADASSTTASTAEINTLAGVTAGTSIASKAVVTDSNVDNTGMRNLTITGTLTAPVVAAATSATIGTIVARPTAQVCSTGTPAITIVVGDKQVIVTKGTACAMSLANPTNTTHDYATITVVSTTAAAHSVTTGAAGVNGASTTITFSAAIGNYVKLLAYQGSWYVIGSTGATIS